MIVTQSYDFRPYASSARLSVSLLGVIGLGLAGNLLYTLAMRWVSPSKGNVFRSFEVILNCGLQVAIEGVPFHWVSVVGIAFLILAVIATGFETDVMNSEKFGRRRFSFL